MTSKSQIAVFFRPKAQRRQYVIEQIKGRAQILLLASMISFLLIGCEQGRVELTMADLGKEIGLSFAGGENFKVTKDLVRQAGQKKFRSLEAVSGARLLKVEVMSGLSPDEAVKMQEERMTVIRSLFSNLPSPYPGMVTNTVVVDDELKPQLQMISLGGQELPLYILMSSVRYTYGAVPAELVSFLGGLFFIYDQDNGTLYRLDYFMPRENFWAEEFVHFFSRLKPAGAIGQYPQLFPQEPERKEGAGQVASSAADQMLHSDALKFKGYNLILIAFEPLGANHVRAYGYPKQTTPNLDAFAKDALLFENAVSPSSWSLPVFMSWFTSMYPSQHRVVNQYSKYSEKEQVPAVLQELSPEAVTLTQVLQQKGYQTAGFTGGASLAGNFGFKVGFDRYYDEKSFGGFDLLMPMTLSWLAERRKTDPFFFFLEGYDVHGRFPLNSQNLNMFLGEEYGGAYTGTPDEYWALRNRSINEGNFTLSEEDIRFWNAVYDTKIFAADKRFGDFVCQLKQLGLYENSIIVVSAGSGNEHLEHGRIDHGFSLYEELVHVPLIIRIPGQQGRIGQLVRTIDIMPTVLDLLDLPPEPGLAVQMQGVSLVPVILGENLNLDGVSETDYLLHSFKRSIKTSAGWKLIVSLDTEKRELYFLKDDPAEQHNVVQENGRLGYELEQQLFKTLQGRTVNR